MTLSKDIEQWKQLKASKVMLEKRMAELRARFESNLDPGVVVEGVTKQIRNRTTYAEDRVYERLHYRDIRVEAFTKRVIDPDKLEQLYLDGALNDDDLRYIREPRYTFAIVEVGGDEDVQGQADNVC